jgi:esterase/lipase superfamily enzyme
MLQRAKTRDPEQNVVVVLFSWPSDGMALPWVSYKSDRSEAAGSGAAVGRAFLKARDFLADLRDRAKQGGRELCGQDIHLLCHSMGNYLLQNALTRLYDFTPGDALPRLFEHVFLCAPDVDDTVLEPGQPLGRLNQIARHVTIYHNRQDTALVVSDYTKGNPERLGGAGAAHPALLHNKVHQVDCTPVVHGVVEHSYYLAGNVNADIRASIDGRAQDDAERMREPSDALSNVWVMRKAQ